MLTDQAAISPAYTGTDGCPNKRASSNQCAKHAATNSANACPAQRSLLCSTHSCTSDKGKNKSKHNKNNHDTFRFMSPPWLQRFHGFFFHGFLLSVGGQRCSFLCSA